jgi:hypothetical protein
LDAEHVKPLEEMGFVYRNQSSLWSSPVMIVSKPKHPGEFPMIIHYKQANSEKQAMLGFLPILEVSMSYSA